jgi:hypothetical protein
MFGKKKTKLGIHAKPRKADEISREYTDHAIQLGHNARQLAEVQEEAERLETVIHGHLKAMRAAVLEAKLAPREAPVKGSSPTPEAAPEAAPQTQGATTK